MIKKTNESTLVDAQSVAKKKRASSYGSLGKNWNWSKMRTDVKIRSDEHLMYRYLIGKLGYTSVKIAELCGCDISTAKQLFYGRASQELMRENLDRIIHQIDATRESLLDAAKTWWANVESEDAVDTTIRIRALLDHDEHYGFQLAWIERHNFDPLHLFIMKQDTDFLMSEGIRTGDAFLVNKADTRFEAGAFYAAHIAGKVWVGLGIMRNGKNYLAVDPTGVKFSLEEFDGLKAQGHILGRCVWRGALM